MSDITGPELRPLGANGPMPPEWQTLPAGRNHRGDELELVSDPRHYDVLHVHSDQPGIFPRMPHEPSDDLMLDALGVTGWEPLNWSGRARLWLRDREAAQLRALEQRQAGQQPEVQFVDVGPTRPFTRTTGTDMAPIPPARRHRLTAAVVTMVAGDGEARFAATGAMGVEGIVAKRRSARYVCGRRSRSWIKIKHRHSAWLDVAGWRPSTRSQPAGAILLANPGRHAGSALPGLRSDHREVFYRFVQRHGTPDGPVIRVPPGAQVRVDYTERPVKGLLREAVARELRASAN